MLQLLPLLFTALTKGPELFEAGKDIYETVTGQKSNASTPEALQAEIETLPADQLKAWTEKMAAQVKMYEAQNDRLRNEQGDITDAMIEKLGPEAAAEIAKQRMITRPWTVRQMVYFLMAPLYIMGVDTYLAWCNIWITFFGHLFGNAMPQLTYMASTFFDTDSTYYSMYQAGVTPAATIVVSYMTLREIGKVGGPKKAIETSIASAVGGLKSLAGAFK